jgi:hypothetical protein
MCTNPALPAGRLEAAIWADILSYLKNPRKILRQLQEHLTSRQQKATDLEKERLDLVSAASRFEEEKARMLAVYRRGRITLEEFDRQLDAIAAEEADARARLAMLDTTLQGQQAVATRIVEAAELLRQLKAKSRGRGPGRSSGTWLKPWCSRLKCLRRQSAPMANECWRLTSLSYVQISA